MCAAYLFEDAKQIIGTFEDRSQWDGHQLYELLESNKFSDVDIDCIRFREFSFRRGSHAYPSIGGEQFANW